MFSLFSKSFIIPLLALFFFAIFKVSKTYLLCVLLGNTSSPITSFNIILNIPPKDCPIYSIFILEHNFFIRSIFSLETYVLFPYLKPYNFFFNILTFSGIPPLFITSTNLLVISSTYSTFAFSYSLLSSSSILKLFLIITLSILLIIDVVCIIDCIFLLGQG